MKKTKNFLDSGNFDSLKEEILGYLPSHMLFAGISQISRQYVNLSAKVLFSRRDSEALKYQAIFIEKILFYSNENTLTFLRQRDIEKYSALIKYISQTVLETFPRESLIFLAYVRNLPLKKEGFDRLLMKWENDFISIVPLMNNDQLNKLYEYTFREITKNPYSSMHHLLIERLSPSLSPQKSYHLFLLLFKLIAPRSQEDFLEATKTIENLTTLFLRLRGHALWLGHIQKNIHTTIERLMPTSSQGKKMIWVSQLCEKLSCVLPSHIILSMIKKMAQYLMRQHQELCGRGSDWGRISEGWAVLILNLLSHQPLLKVEQQLAQTVILLVKEITQKREIEFLVSHDYRQTRFTPWRELVFNLSPDDFVSHVFPGKINTIASRQGSKNSADCGQEKIFDVIRELSYLFSSETMMFLLNKSVEKFITPPLTWDSDQKERWGMQRWLTHLFLLITRHLKKDLDQVISVVEALWKHSQTAENFDFEWLLELTSFLIPRIVNRLISGVDGYSGFHVDQEFDFIDVLETNLRHLKRFLFYFPSDRRSSTSIQQLIKKAIQTVYANTVTFQDCEWVFLVLKEFSFLLPKETLLGCIDQMMNIAGPFGGLRKGALQVLWQLVSELSPEDQRFFRTETFTHKILMLGYPDEATDAARIKNIRYLNSQFASKTFLDNFAIDNLNVLTSKVSDENERFIVTKLLIEYAPFFSSGMISLVFNRIIQTLSLPSEDSNRAANLLIMLIDNDKIALIEPFLKRIVEILHTLGAFKEAVMTALILKASRQKLSLSIVNDIVTGVIQAAPKDSFVCADLLVNVIDDLSLKLDPKIADTLITSVLEAFTRKISSGENATSEFQAMVKLFSHIPHEQVPLRVIQAFAHKISGLTKPHLAQVDAEKIVLENGMKFVVNVPPLILEQYLNLMLRSGLLKRHDVAMRMGVLIPKLRADKLIELIDAALKGIVHSVVLEVMVAFISSLPSEVTQVLMNTVLEMLQSTSPAIVKIGTMLSVLESACGEKIPLISPLSEKEETAIAAIVSYREKREKEKQYHTVWASLFGKKGRSKEEKIQAASILEAQMRNKTFDKTVLPESAKNGRLAFMVSQFEC